MKKYRLFIGILAIITILILGGCGMTSQKETLTREQQDNVVKWIARGYEIESVEFTNFGKNEGTGTYMLSIKINNNDNLGTVYSTSSLIKFDKNTGSIGLDPIDEFASLEKTNPINDNDEVNISSIKIKYLGE
ncbi:hypothetical protein ACEE60_04615 [Streptococcus suis]